MVYSTLPATKCILSRVIDVLRCRLRHAFKGIEKIQFAAHLLHLEKRSGDGGHAPALPHSAFDDGSRNGTVGYVPHRLNKSVDSLRARHSPRAYFADDISLILAKVGRTYLFPGRKPDNVETE